MNRRKLSVECGLRAAALAALAAVVAGCATPRSRIRADPERFASYPPEVQELIRAGRIDMGFTPDQVEMALGRPNRVSRRSVAEGDEVTIWIYLGSRTVTDSGRVYGTGRAGRHPGWVDVQRRVEYESARVEFVDGRVVAIEEQRR